MTIGTITPLYPPQTWGATSPFALGAREGGTDLSKPSERSERGLGSEENSRRVLPIDSEMAGPIKLKLGGMVEGMQENVLAKEFFGSVKVDRDQVRGPPVPLLGHGDEIDTLNWP